MGKAETTENKHCSLSSNLFVLSESQASTETGVAIMHHSEEENQLYNRRGCPRLHKHWEELELPGPTPTLLPPPPGWYAVHSGTSCEALQCFSAVSVPWYEMTWTN